MKKVGMVVYSDENIIKINVEREASCGGNCASCKASCNKNLLIEAENTDNFKVGENVELEMNNKAFLIQSAIGYAFLAAAMVFGGIIGYSLFKTETASVISVFAFLAAALFILRIAFKNKKSDIKIRRC